jgi:hypothetical protein
MTKAVFDVMLDSSKYARGELIWESRPWSAGKPYGVEHIYRSNWTWKL